MFTLLILFFKYKIMKDRASILGVWNILMKWGCLSLNPGKAGLTHAICCLVGVMGVLGITLEPYISSQV